MVNLIISLLFVALIVVLMQKKFPNPILFLTMSLVVAAYYTLSTGNSAVDASGGSKILDIFDTYRVQLISSFGSVGLAMLPIYGYSMYMEKIRASVVLGSIVSKPVIRAKNPYFIGVLIAIVICSVMRIAIVSAFAIMALLFSTLYPAMLRAGLSAKTTMAAIFLGTCFDWGPADFVIAIILGGAGKSDIPGYFLEASIYIVPINIVITALISGFIMKICDNQDGYILGSDAPKDEIEAGEIPPGFYAILPVLPMILIIIFSRVFFDNVVISVITAVLISILTTFIIEFVRKRKLRERLDDVMAWLNGMGGGFTNLFLMVVSIQTFSSMLGKLGGFRWAVDAILNTGVSGWVMFFLIGLVTIVMAMLMGDASSITAIMAGPVLNAATSLSIPFYAAIFPIQTANAFRCLSIGTGPHMMYCCKYADCTPLDIIKRVAVPCLIIFLASFTLSFFILA